jgi:hypothetical protein
MSIVISIVSLVGLLLLGVLLLFGVLGMIRELPELDGQGEPLFDESAAICNAPNCSDGTSDTHQARSQFAWQSRSHSRAPD